MLAEMYGLCAGCGERRTPQPQQQQHQLMDNTVDPNCPRYAQAPQTPEHWLDCPDTLQARLEIFGTTEALPLSTLSTVPGKSVALARCTL